MRAAARAVTSLDKPVGDDDGTAFGDLFASDRDLPEEEIDVSLREDALRQALGDLPDRARNVLRLRYGLGGEDPRSLESIGRDLGLTRERVRQIEQDALARLAVSRELEALREAA